MTPLNFRWIEQETKKNVEFTATSVDVLQTEAIAAIESFTERLRTWDSADSWHRPPAHLQVFLPKTERWYSPRPNNWQAAVRLAPEFFPAKPDTPDVVDVISDSAADWWEMAEAAISNVESYARKKGPGRRNEDGA